MADTDDDAFDKAFSDDVRDAPEPEKEPPQAQEEPIAEPAPEQEAQETEQEAQPPPEPQETPPPQQESRPKVDPDQFKGYLDEREKRQQFEARNRELENELAALRQQQQSQPKEPPPDKYEDPDGYEQYRDQQMQTQAQRAKLEQSEFFAGREYGTELLQEVKAWALKLDDARANSLIAHPSPWHAAVEAYRQEQAASQLQKYDFDLEKMKADWLKEYQAKNAGDQHQEQPPPDTPPPNIPPKVANSGGHIGKAPTISEQERFNRFFS